jgi:hypothetical protein
MNSSGRTPEAACPITPGHIPARQFLFESLANLRSIQPSLRIDDRVSRPHTCHRGTTTSSKAGLSIPPRYRHSSNVKILASTTTTAWNDVTESHCPNRAIAHRGNGHFLPAVRVDSSGVHNLNDVNMQRPHLSMFQSTHITTLATRRSKKVPL